MTAWDALATLLTQGRSLSGNEQNCCYLNQQDGRFANVSFVTGYDFPGDSRAQALMDWDHDGDLDVWQSNRTSPRLRFLRNELNAAETTADQNRWISLKLTGTNCNRDAIGARITVTLANSDQPIVRTVRAGEGYLSQTSKRMHIGLGPVAELEAVSIRWPDGSTESIEGLRTNAHYQVTQGQGRAVQWQRPMETTISTAEIHANLAEPRESLRRIVPHRRLPMPKLDYVDGAGERQFVNPNAPTLVVVWATWCVPCLEEIASFAQHQADLSQLGMDLVLLSVDEWDPTDPDSLQTPFAALKKIGQFLNQGIATDATKTKLDLLQRNLLSRHRPFAIPASFLLDAEGRLASVYQGAVPWETLQADVQTLTLPDSDSRDAAVPLPGRWFVNEVPADVMSVVQKLTNAGLLVDAFDYLETHLLPQTNSASQGPSVWPIEQIANAYLEVGVQAGKARQPRLAEQALRRSIQVSPQQMPAHAALASLFESQNKWADALNTYQSMLQLQPNNPAVLNNMAWILATVDDQYIRDTSRAIQFAKIACEGTRNQVPTMLDTLALAYAQDGQFEQAVRTLEDAITLAKTQPNQKLIDSLRTKKSAYEEERLP